MGGTASPLRRAPYQLVAPLGTTITLALVPQPSLARSVAIRRVVAQAFVDDPLLQWMFPDESTRVESTAAWMGLIVEEYILHARVDTVEIDGEIVAAALWRIPGDARLPHPEHPSLPGLLAALVGNERQLAIGNALRAFSAVRPTEPFAYLQFLAVSPPHQGRGLGREVIRPGVDAAAAAGFGVHLETTNPRNLSFYRSLGFQVTTELTLEVDGPAASILWMPCPR